MRPIIDAPEQPTVSSASRMLIKIHRTTIFWQTDSILLETIRTRKTTSTTAKLWIIANQCGKWENSKVNLYWNGLANKRKKTGKRKRGLVSDIARLFRIVWTEVQDRLFWVLLMRLKSSTASPKDWRKQNPKRYNSSKSIPIYKLTKNTPQ
jgi:hypothetical protein